MKPDKFLDSTSSQSCILYVICGIIQNYVSFFVDMYLVQKLDVDLYIIQSDTTMLVVRPGQMSELVVTDIFPKKISANPLVLWHNGMN